MMIGDLDITDWLGATEPDNGPKCDQLYVKSGQLYRVECRSLLRTGAGWEPAVTYRSEESGKLFTRELDNFLAKFERAPPRPAPRA